MNPTPANLKALDSTGTIQRIPVDGQPGLVVQITGRPGAAIISWVYRYRIGKQQINHTLGRWPALGWSEVKSQMVYLRAKAKAGVRLAPPRLTARSAYEAVKAAKGKVDTLVAAAEKVAELIEVKGRRQAIDVREQMIAVQLGEAPTPAPLPPPPPPDTTPKVREIAEIWYTGHVLVKNKPQTQRWQRWALDKYVLPGLGDLKVTELESEPVFALLDRLAPIPVTANRVKALISKMWSWSEPRNRKVMAGMPNPTRGWERHAETPRERRLSEAEIVTLGEAYRKSPTALHSAAIFVLLTGCREGAVVALEPGTKLDDGLLRFAPGLPGLKGCRRVYVPPVAAKVLKRIEAPVLKRSLWRSWSLLRKAAGLDDVSIHDLRRTFSSVGVDQGHDGEVIDVLQSHSVGKIRRTYQVRSDPALAKVAAEVSDYIAALLGLIKPKIVKTPAKAKAKTKAPAKAKAKV